jgi:hypothetical protein
LIFRGSLVDNVYGESEMDGGSSSKAYYNVVKEGQGS